MLIDAIRGFVFDGRDVKIGDQLEVPEKFGQQMIQLGRAAPAAAKKKARSRMAVESSADRADFLGTSDFGLAGTYTPAGGSASTVNGIFDKPSSSIPLDSGELDVDSNTPTFLCETSDVSSAASGDTISISSVGYTVVGVQEDGQGMTNLVLELT